MIVLTLKEQPSVPLEAEALCPDAIAGLSLDAVCGLPLFLGEAASAASMTFSKSMASPVTSSKFEATLAT